MKIGFFSIKCYIITMLVLLLLLNILGSLHNCWSASMVDNELLFIDKVLLENNLDGSSSPVLMSTILQGTL